MHTKRYQQRLCSFRVRSCQHHRRFVPRRIDCRDDGDVDIACVIAQKLCCRLLASGGNRIDVQIERLPLQMCGDRLCCIIARRRSDGGNHHLGIPHGILRRGCDPHANGFGGFDQFCAGGLRKQDVPGGDVRHTFLAQASGDCLTRLAKTDEGNPWTHASPFSFFWMRRSKRSTLTTTRLCVPSPTRSRSSKASTRKVTLRPSTLVTSAVARNVMPTGVAA